MSGDKALTVQEVAAKIGVTVNTIKRWIKAGNFPEGRKYSPRIIRWFESDVEKWMQSY